MKALPLLVLLSGCAPVCNQMKGIWTPPIEIARVKNYCPDAVIVIPHLVMGQGGK